MLLEQAAQKRFPSDPEAMYVSDRRWKKAVKLLKASAFFNGRDAINPLDLLLLQDCLWNSPESYAVVDDVIREFALRYAFDQQQVENQIEIAQDTLRDIQSSLEEQFAMTLSLETSAGLIKKKVSHYDLSGAKTFQVGNQLGFVKLVLLQDNVTVSEMENMDKNCRWIYVAVHELEKLIRDGGGEVFGYTNENAKLCALNLDVDSDSRLVIKDIANRSVFLCLVTQHQQDLSFLQRWRDLVAQTKTELDQSAFHLRQLHRQFHDALPHNFIDPEMPVAMENTLQQLQQQLDSAMDRCVGYEQRLSHLGQYFA
jgi:MoxR-like ATPase